MKYTYWWSRQALVTHVTHTTLETQKRVDKQVKNHNYIYKLVLK